MILSKILPQGLRPLSSRSPKAAGASLARKINWGEIRPGQPTVLAVNRSQFSKDLTELRARTGLNWPTVSAVKLKEYQHHLVPECDQQQTYLSTFLRERSGAMRQRLTEFGIAFLQAASRKTRIDAVMVGNVDYWQDEALKLACPALGIPFLVLCRENYTIPWTVPWLHDRFTDAKFKFEGAGVAVFSEETKRAIVPGMHDPDDIWVTGAPRYDHWLDMPRLPADQKVYLSLVTFNQPGYGAQDVFNEVLQTFAVTAARAAAPGVKWLVKCKKRADMDEVRAQLSAEAAAALEFSFDVPLFDLFPRSRLVIGYNSLALIEAMLADAPIVMPWWGQARPAKSDLLLDPDDPAVGAVIHVAESPEALAQLMSRAAAGEDVSKGTAEQRSAVFNHHLHVPAKGNASSEVERFVRHFMDVARRRHGAS